VFRIIHWGITDHHRNLILQSVEVTVLHTHSQLTGPEQKDTVSYKGQLLFGRYPCCGGVMFPCWVVTPYQSGPRQMPDGAPLSPCSFRHFIALHCILAVNSHSVLLNYHTHTHTRVLVGPVAPRSMDTLCFVDVYIFTALWFQNRPWSLPLHGSTNLFRHIVLEKEIFIL
jgi:hypothetical protein